MRASYASDFALQIPEIATQHKRFIAEGRDLDECEYVLECVGVCQYVKKSSWVTLVQIGETVYKTHKWSGCLYDEHWICVDVDKRVRLHKKHTLDCKCATSPLMDTIMHCARKSAGTGFFDYVSTPIIYTYIPLKKLLPAELEMVEKCRKKFDCVYTCEYFDLPPLPALVCTK
jgi:hypothetical protein